MAQKILYPVVDGKKQCGCCGQWLEISNFSKFKDKYYSSRCRRCINEYAKKYRDKAENKIKVAQYQKEYIGIKENREKKNKYIREYRKQPYVMAKNTEKNREWKMREKQKAVDYKGGKCTVCGYSKCLTALEFHHTNPEEKETYNSHWTFKRNKNELDKCILVCANCHRELHAKEIWNVSKT